MAGAVLLISGSLPVSSTELRILREFLPLSFVEASHLAGCATGVLLLLVARGLYRKLYRAWIVAMILMLAGFFAPLAKGPDTHEAIGMLAIIGLLALVRGAFYSVPNNSLPTFLDLVMSTLKTGEVARVPLKDFTQDGKSRKRFSQARNRAEREGYAFEIIPKERLEPVLPELRQISDHWLEGKAGAEKGFALGGVDELYLPYFNHAVLKNGETGRILAFANMFQGGNKSELSPDLMRNAPDCPSFVWMLCSPR